MPTPAAPSPHLQPGVSSFPPALQALPGPWSWMPWLEGPQCSADRAFENHTQTHVDLRGLTLYLTYFPPGGPGQSIPTVS